MENNENRNVLQEVNPDPWKEIYERCVCERADEFTYRYIVNRIHGSPPRAMSIMRFRVGLDDGTVHSVEETAEKFGVTAKRVLIIERGMFRVFCCVRRRDRSDRLRKYLEE